MDQLNSALSLFLIHARVEHSRLEENWAHILDLNTQAARAGAQIIVNTEMGLSGYCFDSQAEVEPLLLTREDPRIRAFADLAREHQAYIILGFAEVGQRAKVFHNTALVLTPEGSIGPAYHKINAETRWACPGAPDQDTVFDTPWGRVGVMICSDTYHGLLVRQTALRGADLLVIPANWPVSGGMDPARLWSARARENGIWLAACNRTGRDRKMDCTTAPSCAFSPDGETLLYHTSEASRIHTVSIPLSDGRLTSWRRPLLAPRQPGNYTPIFLDTRYLTHNAKDVPGWFGMPEPEPFQVCSLSGSDDAGIMARVKAYMEGLFPDAPFTLAVLPPLGNGALIRDLSDLIRGKALAVFTCVERKNTEIPVLIPPQGEPEFRTGDAFAFAQAGSARVGLCRRAELLHPETGIAHAKLGCDVLAASAFSLAEPDIPVYCARSLDKVAVAMAASNQVLVCLPPKGHSPWQDIRDPNLAQAGVDLDLIRDRVFHDRVDFEVLLNPVFME